MVKTVPRSPHFSDGIWCHGPSTVMLRWFSRFIHCDTGFPKGFSLVSMARHCGPSFDGPAADVYGHRNFVRLSPKCFRGHGGRVVTLSPPTSAAGVRSPSCIWPQKFCQIVSKMLQRAYGKSGPSDSEGKDKISHYSQLG